MPPSTLRNILGVAVCIDRADDDKPFSTMVNFDETAHKYSYHKSVKPGSSFTAPVRTWDQVRQQTCFRK
jgi:hypothetical protein